MTMRQTLYTVTERDLTCEIVDALHKGNEDVFIKGITEEKDSHGMVCYRVSIECPERRREDLISLLAYAFKIFNF